MKIEDAIAVLSKIAESADREETAAIRAVLAELAERHEPQKLFARVAYNATDRESYVAELVDASKLPKEFHEWAARAEPGHFRCTGAGLYLRVAPE